MSLNSRPGCKGLQMTHLPQPYHCSHFTSSVNTTHSYTSMPLNLLLFLPEIPSRTLVCPQKFSLFFQAYLKCHFFWEKKKKKHLVISTALTLLDKDDYIFFHTCRCLQEELLEIGALSFFFYRWFFRAEHTAWHKVGKHITNVYRINNSLGKIWA